MQSAPFVAWASVLAGWAVRRRAAVRPGLPGRLAVLFALELMPWKRELAPRAARVVLALAVVAGAFSEPWRISLSFGKGFEPPGPEKFAEGRFGSGEPVRVFRGCCLDPPCVFGDPENVFLRRPGDFSSGFCSGAGCNR